MEWRKQTGVGGLTEADVTYGLQSACMFWHRFDRFGRPVLYTRPGKQDMKTADCEQTFLAMCFLMEQGLKLMPPGVCVVPPLPMSLSCHSPGP